MSLPLRPQSQPELSTLQPAEQPGAVATKPPTAELVSLLYDELRAIAVSYFRHQPEQHTLQPTALVHEAFLKLYKANAAEPNPWKGPVHFLGVAATAMRQVLVDHARAKATNKRSGAARVSIDTIEHAAPTSTLDVLALHEAIERFSTIDERAAKVVVLRFFAGLSVQEVAQVLEVSDWTAEQDWRTARAWLGQALGREPMNQVPDPPTGRDHATCPPGSNP